MKKLLIILILFSCGKEDKEVIPECGVDEIYTEDRGCHLPSPCEKLELNLYKDNGQIGCYSVYIVKPYEEIEKGCIPLIDFNKKRDTDLCENIKIGYGWRWTSNQNCNCP